MNIVTLTLIWKMKHRYLVGGGETSMYHLNVTVKRMKRQDGDKDRGQATIEDDSELEAKAKSDEMVTDEKGNIIIRGSDGKDHLMGLI